ncbi:hypothetical protein NBO_24g0022 [Nosema bombycis CQ1]|uniref:Uncharacterized protein n=1 Tax=Nosema bombycis (strain CQ1 / CVCC 102059) TaxID=578461 RepID=R0KWH9_NOSB1|nr:hypothetical protein NBO_24g0022 [Nosema bombycis CQ1]|eukprot:EOB14577.1 hypothetical protein NBO_24g0022 [Nosema bombycis CQ1]
MIYATTVYITTLMRLFSINSSNIKQPHAKLEKLICPIKYMLPNKYNDLPVLSEEDVNICLNDAENISNPAVMLDVSSNNSSSPNEIPNLNAEDLNIVKVPKLLVDESCHLNVYEEDGLNETKYKDDTISNASNVALENNEHDYISKSIACKNPEIRSQYLLKKHFDKMFTEDNPQGYSSIQNHTRRIQVLKMLIIFLINVI